MNNITDLGNDFILYNNNLLGKGAFSTVYMGLNMITNTKVAIKTIPIKNFKNKNKKIKKEINILQDLNHNNICNLIDEFKYKKNHYIVLEYCQNNLHNLIKLKFSLSEKLTKRFMIQLSDALLYLQKKNISHRDIKPHNILIKNNNILKLTDFGLACAFNQRSKMKTICGSPLYMAPEIVNDEEYNSKIDLWSSGIVMYQMLFGKTPFNASTHYELINNINNNCVNFPPNQLSFECIDLLSNLLIKEPQDRITWEDFFDHPFLNEDFYNSSSSKSIPIPIKKKY